MRTRPWPQGAAVALISHTMKDETAQKLAKPDVLGDLLKRTIKDVGGDPDKGIERVLGEQRGGGPSSGSGVGLWTDEY